MARAAVLTPLMVLVLLLVREVVLELELELEMVMVDVMVLTEMFMLDMPLPTATNKPLPLTSLSKNAVASKETSPPFIGFLTCRDPKPTTQLNQRLRTPKRGRATIPPTSGVHLLVFRTTTYTHSYKAPLCVENTLKKYNQVRRREKGGRPCCPVAEREGRASMLPGRLQCCCHPQLLFRPKSSPLVASLAVGGLAEK